MKKEDLKKNQANDKIETENIENTESIESTESTANSVKLDSESTEQVEVSEENINKEENTNSNDSKEESSDQKDKKDAQIDELKDRLLRNMAEFENFRKRSEKEKQAMFDMGASNVINKLLPIIDNFERALKILPESEETKAFFNGMELVYKQLLQNLTEAGVVAIECIGKEFDPNLHNAVMHIEDENVGENIIIEEFQKGYKYKDSVLRYSMVKVAN